MMLRICFGLLFIVLSLVKSEWVDSEAIWQTIWDESNTCQYHSDTNWIHHITLDECKERCLEIKKCNAVQFRSSSRLRGSLCELLECENPIPKPSYNFNRRWSGHYLKETTSCAVVYEHEDFTGKYLTIPVGASWDDLDQHGWNDAASSVKVSPNCLFKGYRHDNMEDLIMNYSSDEAYVGDGGNDHLSSLSCHCSGQLKNTIPKPTCAVVYEHKDFTGKYLNVPVGAAWDDLHQHGWNDEASSIKVSPDCIFKGFKHGNMKEALMTYSSDQSYVGVDNNDQLSSLICECNIEPEHVKLSRASPIISTTTTLPDITTGSEEKVQPKADQVLLALTERSGTTSSPLTDNPQAKSDLKERKVRPSPKQETEDLNSDDDWLKDYHKDMEEFHKDMEEYHEEMAQWRKDFEAEMEDFRKEMEEIHGQY